MINAASSASLFLSYQKRFCLRINLKTHLYLRHQTSAFSGCETHIVCVCMKMNAFSNRSSLQSTRENSGKEQSFGCVCFSLWPSATLESWVRGKDEPDLFGWRGTKQREKDSERERERNREREREKPVCILSCLSCVRPRWGQHGADEWIED